MPGIQTNYVLNGVNAVIQNLVTLGIFAFKILRALSPLIFLGVAYKHYSNLGDSETTEVSKLKNLLISVLKLTVKIPMFILRLSLSLIESPMRKMGAQFPSLNFFPVLSDAFSKFEAGAESLVTKIAKGIVEILFSPLTALVYMHNYFNPIVEDEISSISTLEENDDFEGDTTDISSDSDQEEPRCPNNSILSSYDFYKEKQLIDEKCPASPASHRKHKITITS